MLSRGISSLSGAKQDINVEETTKLADTEAEVTNIFVTLFQVAQKYSNSKPLEGIESFDRKLLDLYNDCNKSIIQTLVGFSNEVDHGNSLISDSRASLESLHGDLTYSSHINSFPSPFFVKYVDSIGKRSKNLAEAISSFENRLQLSSSSGNPSLLIQVLEEQYKALVRCGARLSEVRNRTSDIRTKLCEQHGIRGVQADMMKNADEIEERASSVANVLREYEQFKEERKRNMEKRDKTTDFTTKCARAQKTGFGSGLGKSFGSLGSKPTTGTSTSGSSSSTTGIKLNLPGTTK